MSTRNLLKAAFLLVGDALMASACGLAGGTPSIGPSIGRGDLTVEAVRRRRYPDPPVGPTWPVGSGFVGARRQGFAHVAYYVALERLQFELI